MITTEKMYYLPIAKLANITAKKNGDDARIIVRRHIVPIFVILVSNKKHPQYNSSSYLVPVLV